MGQDNDFAGYEEWADETFGPDSDYCPEPAEDEYDWELAQDQLLAQQELEDFEWADEYYGHGDFTDAYCDEGF